MKIDIRFLLKLFEEYEREFTGDRHDHVERKIMSNFRFLLQFERIRNNVLLFARNAVSNLVHWWKYSPESSVLALFVVLALEVVIQAVVVKRLIDLVLR